MINLLKNKEMMMMIDGDDSDDDSDDETDDAVAVEADDNPRLWPFHNF